MSRKLGICILCFALILNLGIVAVQASDFVSVTSVSISAPDTTLDVGEHSVFTANMNPSNASNRNVRWYSSNDKVARVDDNGFVMALRAGTTEIKVITEDRSKRSTVTLTVKEKEVLPKSISFSEVSHTMNVGDTYTIKYTIYPKDATNKNVHWETNHPSVATVNNGIITAVSEGVCKVVGTTEQMAYSNDIVITVKAQPVNPFNDTNDSSFKTEISSLYNSGVVQGSDGKYRPGDVVTRAELATILTKAFNLTSTVTMSKFSDVLPTSWYFKNVSAAESNRLLSGYPDGTFGPSESVSLEEVAAVSSRLFASEDVLKSRRLVNVDFTCSSWANAYVDYATKEGLVDVTKISTFNRNAKREEVAYMIYNVLKEKGIITSD